MTPRQRLDLEIGHRLLALRELRTCARAKRMSSRSRFEQRASPPRSRPRSGGRRAGRIGRASPTVRAASRAGGDVGEDGLDPGRAPSRRPRRARSTGLAVFRCRIIASPAAEAPPRARPVTFADSDYVCKPLAAVAAVAMRRKTGLILGKAGVQLPLQANGSRRRGGRRPGLPGDISGGGRSSQDRAALSRLLRTGAGRRAISPCRAARRGRRAPAGDDLVLERLSRHGPPSRGDRGDAGRGRRLRPGPAARNISGTSRAMVELGRAADLHGKEAALVFTSGWISTSPASRRSLSCCPTCLILSDGLNLVP